MITIGVRKTNRKRDKRARSLDAYGHTHFLALLLLVLLSAPGAYANSPPLRSKRALSPSHPVGRRRASIALSLTCSRKNSASKSKFQPATPPTR